MAVALCGLGLSRLARHRRGARWHDDRSLRVAVDDGAIDAVLVVGAVAGLLQKWGSGGNRCLRKWVVGGLESLSEAGAERAIVNSAANLEQKIGTSSRPAHLLRFVHPAVHQEIGCPFRDRGANSQSGTVPLGIIDHPIALAGEITIQRVQRGPQLSRGRAGLSLTLFALKMMHHRATATHSE